MSEVKGMDIKMNKWTINTVNSMLDESAKKYADRVAFKRNVDNSIEEIRYKKFYNDVISVSIFFKENNRGKYAIYAGMSYEWIVIFYAILYSNNIVVLLNRDYSVEEVREKMMSVGATKVFCDKSTKGELSSFNLQSVVKKCIADNRISDFYKVNENDVAVIIFTSGTTGKSKNVQLTHQNLCANLEGCYYLIGDVLNGEQFTSNMTVLPPHHAYQITVGIQYQLAFGGSICISKGPKYFLQDLKKYQPGALVLVPIIVEMMYKKIRLSIANQKKGRVFAVMQVISNVLLKVGIDIRRKVFKSILDELGGNLFLIHCGGAELKKEYIEFFHSIGIEVLLGYGISECSPVVSCNRFGKMRKNSVGEALPEHILKIKIVDDEILVKGKTVSPGYYGDDEANKASFAEGWFHTGDLGCIDKDGFLYITGRKKNLIILSNGENVSPERIENQLLKNERIAEVLVKGEKQKNGNEVIVAYIFPGDDYKSKDDESQELVKSAIKDMIEQYNSDKPMYHKISSYYILKEPLKKNALGKVLRR